MTDSEMIALRAAAELQLKMLSPTRRSISKKSNWHLEESSLTHILTKLKHLGLMETNQQDRNKSQEDILSVTSDGFKLLGILPPFWMVKP